MANNDNDHGFMERRMILITTILTVIVLIFAVIVGLKIKFVSANQERLFWILGFAIPILVCFCVYWFYLDECDEYDDYLDDDDEYDDDDEETPEEAELENDEDEEESKNNKDETSTCDMLSMHAYIPLNLKVMVRDDDIFYIIVRIVQNIECRCYAKLNVDDSVNVVFLDKNNVCIYNCNIADHAFVNKYFKVNV